MKRADLLALGGLAAAVIALAWRPSGEFSAWLAFDIAERQPLGSILGRQYLAEPVGALSFRPGSVLILKLLGALGTPLDGWLQALCAGVVVPFLAVGRRWGVERLGLGAVAASAAVALALLTPAGLFNAWHVGEWDLLGAALLLGADLLLLRGRHRAALATLLAAVLLKDSVAVLALCLLAVHAWSAHRTEGTWDTAAGRMLVGLTVLLAVVFLRRPEWGRLLGGGPRASLELHVAGPVGPALYGPAVVALAQLVALVGPVSIAAWLAAERRLPVIGVWALSAVAVLAPEPARFHLYLSYVYGSVGWVAAAGALAVVALARLRGDVARFVLLGVAAFVLLPVLLRMRGDLSSRVFLPLAVPLFGLVLAALREVSGRARGAAVLLAVGLLWQGVGGAWDFGARFLTLERVELRAKRSLVAAMDRPTTLLATHRAWLVHPNELAGLGASEAQLLRRPVLPFAVDRPDGAFAGAPLDRVLGQDVAALNRGGERVLVYEVGLRSEDGTSALRGDFAIGRGSPWPVPPHSFEDDHYRVYGSRDVIGGLGPASPGLLADWSAPLWTPPPRAARVTESLLFGVPLAERLRAVGRVSALASPAAP